MQKNGNVGGHLPPVIRRKVMPNFTKRAIKESFWKLLNRQPLSQISVRAIVEDCGINRNSFYYHFRDIPSLIEEIIREAADDLIKKYPSIASVDEAVEAAFRFTVDNKVAIRHICNSVNRDIYEQYLMRMCEYVVTTYYQTVYGQERVSAQDRDTIILFIKCEIFGLSIDWINSGMTDDAIVKLKQILTLCNGMIEELMEKAKRDAR